ncbi:formate dehydrogenase accessory sulfurtransferase FdhD [Fictibacillus aquaticus]|uniref:Sulfur carrier protein FdhD n=1 Tax=Fictibacillus aquaticus TaxID=2021314 RepID=A0A235FE78_9BACL|nr:formate dehydrogenase accessory sulfurtransferase FdhD [Fictibacillus aquaticus]OYD59237.1 formate dehydrogenase family accessory protein FdhD [Fictibacillus aquaticus]
MSGIAKRTIWRFSGSGDAGEVQEDVIAAEKAFTFVVNGEETGTIVCTPEHVDELAAGFMAGEGIIRKFSDVVQLEVDESTGFAYVQLREGLSVDQEQMSKRFIGSCCGKGRQFYFKSDMLTSKTAVKNVKFSIDACMKRMNEMQQASTVFHQTGGVHNAAIADESGLITIRSDIGRHNSLDKLYGNWLMNPYSLKDKMIVFSGRLSSEVIFKAAKLGVGIIVSKSAPTDLALDAAAELGITAVGFTRKNSCNVYTHPDRILEYK